MFPDLQVSGPGVWPPTMWIWTVRFLVAFAAVAALAPWWRGRLLLCLSAVLQVAAIGVALAASDSRLALGAAIVIFAASILTGAGLMRWLGFRDSKALDLPEWIAFGALFGFGAFSIATGLLSVAGGLNRVTAWAVVLGGGAAGWRGRSHWWPALAAARARWKQGWGKENLRWAAFGAGGLTLIGAGPLVWALAPSVQWDALSAHLPTAGALASNNFAAVSHYWFAYVPGQVYLLFALGLATAGQPAPELIHFTFGVISTILVFGIARRIGGSRAGWIAALCFASMPVVGWEAGSAYMDLFPTGFCFGSMYALARWSESRVHAWLLAAGLLMGLAVACKASAGLVLAPAIIYIAVVCFRQQRSPGAIGSVLLLLTPVGLFLAPWYLRNWVWKRNPFYPAMAGFFQNPEALAVKVNWSHFGAGKGIVYFLRLPYDLVFHGHAFDESGYVVFGFVPLLAVVGAALMIAPRWRAARPLAWMLAGAVACWFSIGQVARYLLPVFPAAAVLASLPLAAIAETRARRLRLPAVVLLAVAGALGIGYLRGVGTRWNYNIPDGYPYLHAVGLESREQYLRRALRVFPVFEYINANRSSGTRVYSVSAQMRWYVNAPVDDAVFRPDLVPLVLMTAGDELARDLTARGYDYVLVDSPLIHDPNHPFFNPSFLRRHTDLAFRQGEVALYKMRKQPREEGGVAAAELLENGGFNVLAGDAPAAWIAFGAPRVVKDPRRAHSAPASVEVTQEDGYVQPVSVSRGQVYTLRMWARADAPKQSAWLQVLWLDQDRKILDTTITPAPVDQQWKPISTSFTVNHPQAKFAQIYARAAAGNRVQVDDASFVQGW